MAISTVAERLLRPLIQGVSLPLRLFQDPLFTGAALFALTRAPVQHRNRLLTLLRERGISSDCMRTLIYILKGLFAAGVLLRANHALNELALNKWHLRNPSASYRFGAPGKPELVVVTGGCSGFGYEMVKGFSKYARVIILDLTPVPPELATSMLLSPKAPTFSTKSWSSSSNDNRVDLEYLSSSRCSLLPVGSRRLPGHRVHCRTNPP